jgi:hypothetical protein
MASSRVCVSLVVSIIALCIFAPTVSAHGANTFLVIARGTYLQPDTMEILQNDTVEIHNSAESNRTVRIDFDGDGLYNGSNDVNCNLASGEYCALWLEPANWTEGQWTIEIIDENGSRMNASLTVQADLHGVNGNPIGYEFGLDDEEPQDDAASSSTFNNWLPLIALASGISGLLLLSVVKNRQVGSSEEE